MTTLVDQPLPGVPVPALRAAPAVVHVVVACDPVADARARVHARFDAVYAALLADEQPDFAAVAAALSCLADLEWSSWSPQATGATRDRLAAWHRAQPAIAAAVASLGQDARDDDVRRELLRRRTWLYADAFREALEWRRRTFEPATLASAR